MSWFLFVAPYRVCYIFKPSTLLQKVDWNCHVMPLFRVMFTTPSKKETCFAHVHQIPSTRYNLQDLPSKTNGLATWKWKIPGKGDEPTLETIIFTVQPLVVGVVYLRLMMPSGWSTYSWRWLCPACMKPTLERTASGWRLDLFAHFIWRDSI